MPGKKLIAILYLCTVSTLSDAAPVYYTFSSVINSYTSNTNQEEIDFYAQHGIVSGETMHFEIMLDSEIHGSTAGSSSLPFHTYVDHLDGDIDETWNGYADIISSSVDSTGLYGKTQVEDNVFTDENDRRFTMTDWYTYSSFGYINVGDNIFIGNTWGSSPYVGQWQVGDVKPFSIRRQGVEPTFYSSGSAQLLSIKGEFSIPDVPLPGSLVLFGSGLVLLFSKGLARRVKKTS